MTNDEQLQADFLRLLERCRGSLIRLCLIHTDRKPDNVKDLFQDIVYNLWLSFPKLREKGSAHSWVYGVALNVAMMHHRSHQKHPDFVDLDENLTEALADNDNDELIETLYHLIDRLDKDDKTLLFFYIDHVPQKEIAAIYHTTEMSINHRINRIKKKLKQMYEHEQ